MRAGNPGVPTASEWVADVLAPGGRVGIDPGAVPFFCRTAEELKEAISKKNHELVYLYNVNLVDEIWKDSRPKPPSKQIRIHPSEIEIWVTDPDPNNVSWSKFFKVAFNQFGTAFSDSGFFIDEEKKVAMVLIRRLTLATQLTSLERLDSSDKWMWIPS